MLKIYDPIYYISIDGGPWERLEDLFDTNWFVTDEDLPERTGLLQTKIFQKQKFCLMTFLFRKLMIIFATIIFPEQEHAGLFSKISPNSRCYISTLATENILKSAKDFGFVQRIDFARM